MTTGPTVRSSDGFISVEFLVATAMSFVVLVFVTNFIVIQYGRGVVRAAADDAARAGSRVQSDPSALNACQTRADSTLEGVQKLTHTRTATCNIVAGPTGEDRMEVVIDASFTPWLPGIPIIREHAVASSLREKAPESP